ncbi:hypothetical protein ACXGQW_06850 [Wenyingzhuangia sp. IMCC45533]
MVTIYATANDGSGIKGNYELGLFPEQEPDPVSIIQIRKAIGGSDKEAAFDEGSITNLSFNSVPRNILPVGDPVTIDNINSEIIEITSVLSTSFSNFFEFKTLKAGSTVVKITSVNQPKLIGVFKINVRAVLDTEPPQTKFETGFVAAYIRKSNRFSKI